MSVVRINKNVNYTIMSNYHFREKNMTLKAKGLLSFMLSLPDDWDYSIAGLVALCKENERAIKSTLKELQEFGYLRITKLMPCKAENRSSIEYIYDIFEQPLDTKNQGVQNVALQNVAVQNDRQQNTNKQNTNKQNTNIYNKKENIKRKNKTCGYSTSYNIDEYKNYCKEILMNKKTE